MNPGWVIAAGVCTLVVLGGAGGRWFGHSGQAGTSAQQDPSTSLREPATEKAMQWCSRGHPGTVTVDQWQKRSGSPDPDVAAGFTGHDPEELALAAAINEQIEMTREAYLQIVSGAAAQLAGTTANGSTKPNTTSGSAPKRPVGYVLPLQTLSNSERAQLCTSIAAMRDANISMVQSIASINQP